MLNGAIVNPYKPYAYYNVLTDTVKLANAYPESVSVRTIGFSVQKRSLPLLTLGHGAKKILLAGAHHGREYVSAAFLMKMAEEYAWHYRNGSLLDGFFVREEINEVCIHIVPMVNPDGAEICIHGMDEKSQMRFKGADHRVWKANAEGVDLNRNYPCCWEQLKSPGGPGPEGYKGNAPASEPEVKAVMKLCRDNAYALAASFHTKGEEIYYADSETDKNLPGALRIAQKLLLHSGYALAPVSSDPAVFGGGFENWFRLAFGRYAFLIELAPSDNSPLPFKDSKFEAQIWSKARALGLVLADAARGL